MNAEERAKERERYRRRRDRVLSQKRERYAQNPEMMRERNRAHYAKHREARKVRAKAIRARDAVKIRARNREYARLNPEKRRRWQRKWNASNKWRLNEYDSKRRAVEKSARTDRSEVRRFLSWVSNQDWLTCSYCKTFIPGNSVHIDHIIPITRGGDHHPSNFAIACKSCNSSKHDLLLSEWPRCPEHLRFIQV